MTSTPALTPLFHGTSARCADAILSEGVFRTSGPTSGHSDSVCFTQSLEAARQYAMWATLRDAARLGDRPPLRSKLAEPVSRASGDHVAVIVAVQTVAPPLLYLGNQVAPVLPWETRCVEGATFYASGNVPVVPDELQFGVIHVPQLDAMDVPTLQRELAREYASRFSSGPFAEAIPDPMSLFGAAEFANSGSPVHGWSHSLGVAAVGIRILEAGSAADPSVLFAFAVLHDSQRATDYPEVDHGEKAASVARRISGTALHLNDSQLDLLCGALARHNLGEITDDATVGACWDADRLTLPRIGMTPDPRLLSTDEGRSLARDLGRIPRPEDCDLAWVTTRLQQLAIPADAVDSEIERA